MVASLDRKRLGECGGGESAAAFPPARARLPIFFYPLRTLHAFSDEGPLSHVHLLGCLPPPRPLHTVLPFRSAAGLSRSLPLPSTSASAPFTRGASSTGLSMPCSPVRRGGSVLPTLRSARPWYSSASAPPSEDRGWNAVVRAQPLPPPRCCSDPVSSWAAWAWRSTNPPWSSSAWE